jgi:glucosamine kinase
LNYLAYTRFHVVQPFYVGVDGGGSKCIVRLENAEGQLLGIEKGGSANIRISPAQAWNSINDCLNKLLQNLHLTFSSKQQSFHAAMGLAGCEMQDALKAFNSYQHPFQSLIIRSDAHIACLGAHKGQDGAIIIAGTGSVGYQVQGSKTVKIGGWGFPHDDEGGGAWIGLEAIKVTLKQIDGRHSSSVLGNAILKHFHDKPDELVAWANQANSTAFATLAPIVIEQAQAGEPLAINILQRAANALDQIGTALMDAQTDSTPLPCSLIGGITPFLESYLSQTLRERLSPCQLSPDAGAILLARQHAKECT